MKRSTLELKIDILAWLKKEGPLTKTRVMQLSNINYQTLEAFLPELENKGLVKVDLSRYRSVVTITELGLEILGSYMKLKNLGL